MFIRALPLIGILMFVAVGFVWRGWLQYRKYGHSGFVLFRGGDSRRNVRDVFFCLLFVGIILQTVVAAAAPTALAPTYLVYPPLWLTCLGSLLMLKGLAIVFAAQLQMGISWRVGIDSQASTGLVTQGLYQFCRNPIYLGLLTNMGGLALMLPTWPTVLFTAAVVWCIRTQVIEEESYLLSTYGAEFRGYAARIGRFVPCLGRI